MIISATLTPVSHNVGRVQMVKPKDLTKAQNSTKTELFYKLKELALR